MKKLLTASAMALTLFIAASCEKPQPDPPAPAQMTMETTTTFTPKGATKPTVVQGDVEEGESGIVYSIAPKLNMCNCAGSWSFKVAELNNNQYSGTQNMHTGVVSFMCMLAGNYKITITYKCPDGSSVSKTVTITIK